MKIAPALAVAVAVSLSGCAALRSSDQAYVDDTDHARVAAVEQVARRNGVLVHWINLPVKAQAPAVGVAPALGEPSGT